MLREAAETKSQADGPSPPMASEPAAEPLPRRWADALAKISSDLEQERAVTAQARAELGREKAAHMETQGQLQRALSATRAAAARAQLGGGGDAGNQSGAEKEIMDLKAALEREREEKKGALDKCFLYIEDLEERLEAALGDKRQTDL